MIEIREQAQIMLTLEHARQTLATLRLHQPHHSQKRPSRVPTPRLRIGDWNGVGNPMRHGDEERLRETHMGPENQL